MMKGVGRAAAAAGLAIAIGGTAVAGEIADKAAEAEAKLAAGDAAAALAAFDAAEDAFWMASPLQFRVATFATSITGFGVYTPKDGSTFHSGDAVNIYLEPVGYGFLPTDNGYEVLFNTGIEIRQGDLVLAKTDDLGTADWKGPTRSRTVDAAISVTLPAMKPGDYQMLVTLTDTQSHKSATTTLPFSLE